METKLLDIQVKADGPEGKVSGYGSVFNVVDRGGDLIRPGAFAKSLLERKPKMLWQHDKDKVLGVWDVVIEDQKGLYMEGRIAKKTQLGADALELVSMGALDGLSIGYIAKQAETVGGVRELLEVELFETSLVTMAMNEQAGLTDLKNMSMTVRDFENWLRANGFSKSDSKTIVADGFKKWTDGRDDQPEHTARDGRDAELIAALEKLNQNLGGHNG